MREVMDILLIRFAIIVGLVTLLIIAGFTAAIVLKRRGGLGRARRLVEPAVRAWAARPDAGPPHAGRYPRPGAARSGGRAELGRLAVRGALHYLDRTEARRTEGTHDRRER